MDRLAHAERLVRVPALEVKEEVERAGGESRAGRAAKEVPSFACGALAVLCAVCNLYARVARDFAAAYRRCFP